MLLLFFVLFFRQSVRCLDREYNTVNIIQSDYRYLYASDNLKEK